MKPKIVEELNDLETARRLMYKNIKAYLKALLKDLVVQQKSDKRMLARLVGTHGDLMSTIAIRRYCIQYIEELRLEFIKNPSEKQLKVLAEHINSDSHYYQSYDSRFINFRNLVYIDLNNIKNVFVKGLKDGC